MAKLRRFFRHRARLILQPFLLLLICSGLLLAIFLPWTRNRQSGFQRSSCNTTLAQGITNGTIDGTDTRYFISAIVSNIILTLNGCKKYCGAGMGIYPDAGARLLEWLLPILLLTFNMVSENRTPFLSLGDPICAMKSLLAIWNDRKFCYCLARAVVDYLDGKKMLTSRLNEDRIKIIAIILITATYLNIDLDAEEVIEKWFLAREIGYLSPEQFSNILWATATKIASYRVYDVGRTVLAVLLYIFQVLQEFVPAIATGSSISGGKIGAAILLSWLLAHVLLSNILGKYISQHECIEALEQLQEDLHVEEKIDFRKGQLSYISMYTYKPNSQARDWKKVYKAINYTPRKPYQLRLAQLLLDGIALLSIFMSLLASTFVLAAPPTDFSCRNVLMFGIIGGWILSAILTWVSRKLTDNPATLNDLLYVKNFVFATVALGLIIASSVGLFNNCVCWSAAVGLHHPAKAVMNPVSMFNYNDNERYPAVVFPLLSMQGVVVVLLWFFGRQEFLAMRWSTTEMTAFRSSVPKLTEAEEMYQRALRGKEKAWGPDHTSTLETVNNLGLLYYSQGKLTEAEEMYQRALRGKEKAWGPDHTSTLETVNNLGLLYYSQGKLTEAEEMYQRALRGFEKAWGPDHTSTLETVNNLGLLYAKQGKLTEAEEMYQRTARIQEGTRS